MVVTNRVLWFLCLTGIVLCGNISLWAQPDTEPEPQPVQEQQSVQEPQPQEEGQLSEPEALEPPLQQEQPLQAEPAQESQPQTVLVDARDVPYSEMTPQEQEAYKKRVKSEVAAAITILLFFLLFVIIISAFRFGRNYSGYLSRKKQKKTEYVDIWGNPRVQIDDLPTDEEMMGEDTYQ